MALKTPRTPGASFDFAQTPRANTGSYAPNFILGAQQYPDDNVGYRTRSTTTTTPLRGAAGDRYQTPGDNRYQTPSRTPAAQAARPLASRSSHVLDNDEPPPVGSVYDHLKVTPGVSTAPLTPATPAPTPQRGQEGAGVGFAPRTPAQTQYGNEYAGNDSIMGPPRMDDRWVTIFGFPPDAVSYVLRQFQSYGDILQHRTSSVQGNWMHVQYQTRVQAQIALSKNGMIIDGRTMIGVTPCVEKIAADDGVTGAEPFAGSNSGALRQRSAQLRNATDEYDVDSRNIFQRTQRVSWFTWWNSLWSYLFG